MNQTQNQCYAIVPAAGRSQRMNLPEGDSKLLLPWGNQRILDFVLRAWTQSQVCETVCVIRSDDHQLIDAAKQWPVSVLLADTPPLDMKASIIIGLNYLSHKSEIEKSGIFVAPADLPTLTSQIIDQLIDSFRTAELARVAVPFFGDRQGHPVLIPWEVTKKIHQLRECAGINQVVSASEIQKVLLKPEQRVADIDTPEEYKKAVMRHHEKCDKTIQQDV